MNEPVEADGASTPESRVAFRACVPTDVPRCLAVFDANCPDHFAPNERADFRRFLAEAPDGYEVCLIDGRVVGAFGLLPREPATASNGGVADLRWVMIDPACQGVGLGSAVMRRVVAAARRLGTGRAPGVVRIAASHRSAPFFARFGAEVVQRTPDGWGPGMHRVDMRLGVDPAP